MHVINVIKEKREHKNLKQETVAKAVGVDRATVSKWESGEFMPRADKLPMLAQVLDCSIDELFRKSTA